MSDNRTTANFGKQIFVYKGYVYVLKGSGNLYRCIFDSMIQPNSASNPNWTLFMTDVRQISADYYRFGILDRKSTRLNSSH